jgi:hypothetical protein
VIVGWKLETRSRGRGFWWRPILRGRKRSVLGALMMAAGPITAGGGFLATAYAAIETARTIAGAAQSSAALERFSTAQAREFAAQVGIPGPSKFRGYYVSPAIQGIWERRSGTADPFVSRIGTARLSRNPLYRWRSRTGTAAPFLPPS